MDLTGAGEEASFLDLGSGVGKRPGRLKPSSKASKRLKIGSAPAISGPKSTVLDVYGSTRTMASFLEHKRPPRGYE